MLDHTHITVPSKIDVFVYAKPHAKNNLIPKFILISFMPRFVLTCSFESLRAHLTIPT